MCVYLIFDSLLFWIEVKSDVWISDDKVKFNIVILIVDKKNMVCIIISFLYKILVFLE